MGHRFRLILVCLVLAIVISFRGTLHHRNRGSIRITHGHGFGGPYRLQRSSSVKILSNEYSRLSFGSLGLLSRLFMTTEPETATNETSSTNATDDQSTQNATVVPFNAVGYEVGQLLKCVVVDEDLWHFVVKTNASLPIIIPKLEMRSEDRFYFAKKVPKTGRQATESVNIEITEIDNDSKTYSGKYLPPIRVGKRKFEELANWGVNQFFNATVISVNSTGLVVEMDGFEAQGTVAANILPKSRPIEEQFPVNSTIKVMIQYLNLARKVIIFELFEGRSDEEQANLAKLPRDKWMQSIIVEVRANQLKVRPVASGVTEMVYINQIPLELIEMLMTRVSLDPKSEHILFNQSISNLEVIFNVGDVIQTRVIEVEEYPRDYLALTMCQRIPKPIPDPERMNIYDAVEDIDIVGPDPYELSDDEMYNPEGWVDAASPNYEEYVRKMKKIAGIRQKPTIVDANGKRMLHPFYENDEKPKDFQLGPKFVVNPDRKEYFNKLKKMAMKGFRVAAPMMYKITPLIEQLARNSYTYDFSDENRLDFGNQALESNPQDNRYIEYQDWEFERCMLWWRGKPFKKTILFLQEEKERHLTQNPDERIWYESPTIKFVAWSRYIRSMEEPDSDEEGGGSNEEREAFMRSIQREVGEMEGIVGPLGEDAVGYGVPDLNTNRLYRFLDQDTFPEEMLPELTFYAKEDENRAAMNKYLHVSDKAIEDKFNEEVSKLIQNIEKKGASGGSGGSGNKRGGSGGGGRYGSRRDDDDSLEDPENDLEGDEPDDSMFPHDAKLDYWLEQDLKKMVRTLKSRPRRY